MAITLLDALRAGPGEDLDRHRPRQRRDTGDTDAVVGERRDRAGDMGRVKVAPRSRPCCRRRRSPSPASRRRSRCCRRRYYKPIDNIGLLAYFDALINRVGADLRLYLYNFPQLSGVPYALEFVQALKEKYPRQLLGLKDSSGDMSYSIAMAAGVADFDVFPSAEGTLNDADRYRWAGCISATVNVTVRAAAAGWKTRGTVEGERAVASASAQRAILARSPVIAAVKQALAVKYQRPEWARVVPPLQPLTAEQAAQQARDLASSGI